MRNRPHTHADRELLLIGVLFACVVILSVLAVALAVQQSHIHSNQDKVVAAQKAQREAAYATCLRIQTLRDAVNLHSYADYRHRLKNDGQRVAAYLRYAPPTDCRQAEQHPLSYLTPRLVPFFQVACRFDPPRHVRPVPLPACPPDP